jgi:hypothetical protein
MNSIHLHPRVVFYRQGSSWIAHCLEFDLAGEGSTREEALERLNEALVVKVEVLSVGNRPADLFKPADREYFAMYDAGDEVAVGALRLASHRLVIDQTRAREYRDVL